MLPYIKIDTYPVAFVQFVHSFRQELGSSFILVLHFLYLRLVSLDYFIKYCILLGFSFFSFYIYLYMFHQPAKVFCKSFNCIIFKINIPLSDLLLGRYLLVYFQTKEIYRAW